MPSKAILPPLFILSIMSRVATAPPATTIQTSPVHCPFFASSVVAEPREPVHREERAERALVLRAGGGRHVDGAEILPRTVLENLIQELDSDDAVVRVLAIVALEKITQQRLGYDPYAERQRRQSSIQKWIFQLESGSLHAASGPE